MKQPPFIDADGQSDPSALVLVDWSWWNNKAYRVAGIDGMLSSVVGYLCGVLAYNPAHIALAIDAAGETDRHRMVHPTDPDWKYKGGRDPKPDDFYAIMDRCTEIADLHSIPILWATGKEADDIMATATAKARAAGYRVWLCSADKDMAALCESSDESGILTGMWDNFDDTYRGPEEVREKFGVMPSQIPDLLAIEGDTSDNIPGVPGLGRDKARELLKTFKTLENALNVPATEDDAIAAVEAQLKELAKIVKKSADPAERQEAAAHRVRVMHGRALAKWHKVLLEHEDLARFSRDLTALDCDAPISIPWHDLPTGGYQVGELREKYLKLGFTRKAADVPAFRKRLPWRLPYEAP